MGPTIDAFQLWMYEHNPREAERTAYWLKLNERFGADLDWEGIEEHLALSWQRQLHLFEVPFYYIEYESSTWCSWSMEKLAENQAEALSQYKIGLSLGGSKSLPTLFKETGVPWF